LHGEEKIAKKVRSAKAMAVQVVEESGSSLWLNRRKDKVNFRQNSLNLQLQRQKG
jgi:hypothetical protein